MLDVALLGTGGMMPMPDRFLTAMLARFSGRMLLIDCGEGTQITMKMLGWGFKNIDVICFTHYHADHISGLPGILLTIGNAGRKDPLFLVGPAGLTYAVEGMRRIAPELPYEIKYMEMEDECTDTLVIGDFRIRWALGEHNMKCFAYRIDIARRGKFSVERAMALQLPKNLWGTLQRSGDLEYEGKMYTVDMVMGEDRKGIALSYCTDTRPVKAIETLVAGSDLFICEGMYGEEEKKQKAIQYTHMVFSEAALLAKNAVVKELWLTHFSPSLSVPALFLSNATDIFENTSVGQDRMTTSLFFPQQ